MTVPLNHYLKWFDTVKLNKRGISSRFRNPQKIFGSVVTTLIILYEEMEDIMKIAISLKEYGLLIKTC